MHRWKSSHHTSLMVVKSNSRAEKGTFGGLVVCCHGSQACIWDSYVSFWYKFVLRLRNKEDFTILASLFFLSFSPDENNNFNSY